MSTNPIQRRMQQALKTAKQFFPNAKYHEASDPQIEDDSIVLTSDLHVQVSSLSGDAVALCRAEGYKLRYWHIGDENDLSRLLSQAKEGTLKVG